MIRVTSFFILILSLLSIGSFSQNSMTIDQPFIGIRHFSNQKFIHSTQELDFDIQDSLDEHLTRIFGSLVDSLNFSRGQIIDWEYNNVDDSLKYLLHYNLKDNSNGIIKYNVIIELDNYGNVIDCNWQKKAHLFCKPSEIEKVFFDHVYYEYLGQPKKYYVDLVYVKDIMELVWEFRVPRKEKNDFNVYQVSWEKKKVINEFFTTTIISH